MAVILNNALVELLSLHTRISVGEWGPRSPRQCCPPAVPLPPPLSAPHRLPLRSGAPALRQHLRRVAGAVQPQTGLRHQPGGCGGGGLWLHRYVAEQLGWDMAQRGGKQPQSLSCGLQGQPPALIPIILSSLPHPLHLCPGVGELARGQTVCGSPTPLIWATMVASQAPTPGGHSGWEQSIQGGKKGPAAFGARKLLEGAALRCHSTWVPSGVSSPCLEFQLQQ